MLFPSIAPCHEILISVLGLFSFTTLIVAKQGLDEKASYAPGQAIPVSCLNRTMYELARYSLGSLYVAKIQISFVDMQVAGN